jgi:hypothetical protein
MTALGQQATFEKDGHPQLRQALLLWFKAFYEAVGLRKLNGVAINGDLTSRRASFSSEQRISTRLIMWPSGPIT